jgi:predicted dehydrogenase
MSQDPSGAVSILMVAIGGYGFHYLRTILDEFVPGRCRLAGVVDPLALRSGLWPTVARLGVPVSSTVEEFYAAGHRADLAVVASPIHHHVPQSSAALHNLSHVLCDKPLGATIQEAEELMRVRDRSGRSVTIGYQWSFSSAILSLKRDIMAGAFGRPRRLSTLCLWPRDAAYYRRNDWAGRMRDAATGRWVLDGPANNAMAHFLHNLFFVLGRELHLSARPREVQAERYRAYPVETDDTVACRAFTDEGIELLFYASHVTSENAGPLFRFEFEDALVTFTGQETGIVAEDSKGRRKSYGSPDDTPQFRKLAEAVDAVRPGTAVVCGLEAARSQTLCVNAVYESAPEAARFPEGLLRGASDPERVFVAGLGETLQRCYRNATLPSEAGVGWAVPGASVGLTDYLWFPGGTPPPDRTGRPAPDRAWRAV